MAELPKENLSSIDLLASIATAVINVEGSVPSSENASGENIKRKLDRGDSPKDCNSPKRVQFVTQPSLDQREDDVSDIVHDIYGSNTNSNAVHYYKSNESAGSLVSNNSPGFTHHRGPHSSKHSGSDLPVTAPGSPTVEGCTRANSFSTTLQKNITTGTGCTLISLNFSHQKMCVW